MKLKVAAVVLSIVTFTLCIKLVDSRTKQMFLEMDLKDAQTQADKLKYELEEATQPIYPEDKEYIGEFKITHYDACFSCCGKTDGITASGAKVCDGVTVAVDPSVIPLGTYIYIEGVGYRVAQDTGGAVKGNRIDVYVSSHEQAQELGTKTTKVWRMK